MHTEDYWSVKALIRAFLEFAGLDSLLMNCEEFQDHVDSLSLASGELMQGLRRSPIFLGTEEAIYGISRLMNPTPTARLATEKFVKLLRDRHEVVAWNRRSKGR